MTDLADLLNGAAPARRKSAHREWSLQTQIKRFVREAVACPHQFAAHDRSRNFGGKQHMWEAVRGVVAGWPDTELLLPGGATFRCELKARDGKPPSTTQEKVGAAIADLGHAWAWVDTVTGYYQAALAAGVPFRPYAAALAASADALLAQSAPARKARAPGRARVDKPTASQVRRVEAIRTRTRF